MPTSEPPIGAVRDAALRLLLAFADPAFKLLLPDMTRELMPRPGDAARVFAPDVAEHVERVYQRLWATDRPVIAPKPGQTEVTVAACAAGALTSGDAAAARFPGGYLRIAHLLVPARIWIAWKFVVPGARSGMAFNGLVAVEGTRFVWYPKPWNALGVDRPGN